MNFSFFVVDDGELDCFVVKKIISQSYPGSQISTFINAGPVLEIIKADKTAMEDLTIVILLDLNMPIMSGFQFLEEFEKLSDQIKSKYKIIILSSTKNQADINKLAGFRSVSNFIEKPLSKTLLTSLIDDIKTTFENK